MSDVLRERLLDTLVRLASAYTVEVRNRGGDPMDCPAYREALAVVGDAMATDHRPCPECSHEIRLHMGIVDSLGSSCAQPGCRCTWVGNARPTP